MRNHTLAIAGSMPVALSALLLAACLDPGEDPSIMSGNDVNTGQDAVADASTRDSSVDTSVSRPDVTTAVDTSPRPLPDVAVVGPPDVGLPDAEPMPDVTDVMTPQDVGELDIIPPPPACDNPADLSICMTCGGASGPACGEACPNDQAWAQEESTNCGLQCLGDADPGACSTMCLEDATGLSTDCAGCYAGLFLCTIDNCLSQCVADPSGQVCQECTASNCMPDFIDCGGAP